ncbi:MAG: DUF6659 family protein, partial [Nitrosarchaeum sp.]
MVEIERELNQNKMPEIDIEDYEKRCQLLLQDDEVRFAALLNEFGEIL